MILPLAAKLACYIRKYNNTNSNVLNITEPRNGSTHHVSIQDYESQSEGETSQTQTRDALQQSAETDLANISLLDNSWFENINTLYI